MMSLKVTIKDIAKMANVSITTVSLVLNDKPSRISQAKKDEIISLASKYHYQANISAKNLASNQSKTIGLLIPDIENFFFAQLAKYVEEELRKQGYSLILANSNDLYENDVDLIQNLVNRGVDGLLVTISNESYKHQTEMKELLSSITIPVVMMDRTFENFDISQVYFDNQLGGFLATEYAIHQGHKNIAMISVRKEAYNGNYRFKGYLKALEKYDLPFYEKYIFEGNYKYESGYELASNIFAFPEITAVVCSNDLIAYGVIQKTRELGKLIPEDLLVIGYDDLKFSSMLGLHLPSIHQDIPVLGFESVKVLMEELTSKKHQVIVLQPSLSV